MTTAREHRLQLALDDMRRGGRLKATARGRGINPNTLRRHCQAAGIEIAPRGNPNWGRKEPPQVWGNVTDQSADSR
jgi:hypothetical protein